MLRALPTDIGAIGVVGVNCGPAAREARKAAAREGTVEREARFTGAGDATNKFDRTPGSTEAPQTADLEATPALRATRSR